MGLFDQIIGALNDPNQTANTSQLGQILDTVQQLSGRLGTSPEMTQTAMSILGSNVRSALQEKRATQGQDAVQTLVNQLSGTTPNLQAVQALFSPQQQTQIARTISQRTGINEATLQSLLPALVPIVLNLLQTGAQTQHPNQGSNSVLSQFLDADQDGDVDIADTIRLAGQFLNR